MHLDPSVVVAVPELAARVLKQRAFDFRGLNGIRIELRVPLRCPKSDELLNASEQCLEPLCNVTRSFITPRLFSEVAVSASASLCLPSCPVSCCVRVSLGSVSLLRGHTRALSPCVISIATRCNTTGIALEAVGSACRNTHQFGELSIQEPASNPRQWFTHESAR